MTTTPRVGDTVRTPDGQGVFQGVTGHLYAVEYTPTDVVSVTAYPILSGLLASGDVWRDGHLYSGVASDGLGVFLPGSAEYPDQTEAYLEDFPTPAHW